MNSTRDISVKHVWLYLALTFAVLSGLIALVMHVYFPTHFELTKSLISILFSASIGAGIGARAGRFAAEPAEETRAQYRERAFQQSRGITHVFAAPIVWVGLFTMIGFTIIYHAT